MFLENNFNKIYIIKLTCLILLCLIPLTGDTSWQQIIRSPYLIAGCIARTGDCFRNKSCRAGCVRL